ncbi:hypothetical protein C8J57DRAFT_1500380 [Mycena rebaudengoi]|nr:hypothetical protein C8J57DRAFT_1500380 [Mycena rebaudengoi]
MVTKSFPESSSYELDLPEELRCRRIHAHFHASLLREHQQNDLDIFPSREVGRFYDFGMPDDEEWLVENILEHSWVGPWSVRFRVKWTAGDITWEPPKHLEEVRHLDEYYELHGSKIRFQYFSHVKNSKPPNYLYDLMQSGTEEKETKTPAHKRGIMAGQDADMTMPYRDSEYEYHIEDRAHRNTFHQRKSTGAWMGDMYVAAIGDSLDVPPPPRGPEPAANTGANPVPHHTTTTPATPPTAYVNQVPARPTTEPPTGAWGSPAAQRHWESPQHCEDVLRQNAMQSRPRFRDQPYWSGNDRRGERNRSRGEHDRSRGDMPHWEQVLSEFATRVRDDRCRLSDDNRMRAHEDAVACNRGNTPNAKAPMPSAQIGYRYPNNNVQHIIESPDLCQAPRASNGHPQVPDTVRCNAPDFDGSDDGALPDTDYVEREESQLTQVQARPSRPGTELPAIATPEQAQNLNQSALPWEFRSEGKAYLLRYQQDIEPSWRTTPIRDDSWRIHRIIGVRRLWPQLALIDVGTSPPNPTDVAPEELAAEFAKWTKLPNSAGTLFSILHYYVFLATKGWPTGLRNMLRWIPSEGSDTPLNDDVLAYHTILVMAPANRRDVPHQFCGFFNAMIIMFSVPRLFAAIIQAGSYPPLSLVLAHYPFLTDNITMVQVAAWFVQQGILLGSMDVLLLELFARAQHNAKTGNPNLENKDWGEAPHDITEAIAMSPMPAWHDLVHVPPNVPTEHSRTPGETGGIASLSQMDVKLSPLHEGSETSKLQGPSPPPSMEGEDIDVDNPVLQALQ